MTRFAELTALAAARRAADAEYEAGCRFAAQALAQAWHAHLGGPAGSVAYRELSAGLVPGAPLWPVGGAFPGFRPGGGGWLCFAVDTALGGPGAEAAFAGTAVFAVRLRGHQFALRAGEREWAFGPHDPAALAGICADLEGELRRHLTGPPVGGPRPPGLTVCPTGLSFGNPLGRQRIGVSP